MATVQGTSRLSWAYNCYSASHEGQRVNPELVSELTWRTTNEVHHRIVARITNYDLLHKPTRNGS